MMNRLRCLKQLALLNLIFIIFQTNIQAQCPDSLGTNWGVTLTNPAFWSDTIYMDANCDDTLAVPMMTFTVPPNSTQSPFGPSLATISPGSLAFGDTIKTNTTVNLAYHLTATENGTGNPLNDTFCIELVYIDTVAPTFIGFLDEADNFTPFLPPQSLTVSCPDDYPDTIRLIAADCGMNADTVMFTETPTVDPAMFCSGGAIIMRTWTSTDPNGNVAEFTQFITIVPDTELPVLGTAPVSESVSCGSDDFDTWLMNQVNTVMTPGNATDNCGVMTINYGIVSGDTTDLNCDQIVVEFNVVDNCGNTNPYVVSYTVTDNMAPVMTGLPAQDTVLLNCGDSVPAPPGSVTATDDCDTSTINVVFVADTVLTCDHTFEITRTWSAADGCGNTNTFTQKIIMNDNSAPTFDLPADVMYEATNGSATCVFDTDTTATGVISNLSDNCSSLAEMTISFTDSVEIGACANDTTIFRIWTVTDLCGQSTSQTQTITIEDNKAPSFITPADANIACDEIPDPSLTGAAAVDADNCPSDLNAMVSYTDTTIPSASCPETYTIERLWRYEDACANADSALQMIFVSDVVAPTFSVQAQDMNVICDGSGSEATTFAGWLALHGNAEASDNCAPTDSLTWVAYNTGTTDPVTLGLPSCPSPDSTVYRTAIVDFIVFDPCGNSDTTTATFNVIDNEAPTLSNLPQDIVTDTDSGVCNAVLTLPLPVIQDNCGNQVLTDNPTLGMQFSIPGGSDPLETPVDDVVFTFSVPQPPFSANSDVTLIIDLVGVDAEAPTEFFNIVAEDGTVLGQTNLSPDQCGNSQTVIILTADQYNQWAFDGSLTITLETNIPTSLPGRFAVNALCTDSAYVTLDYELVYPAGLHFEYEINGGGRIDGGTGLAIATPTETFDLGQNTVVYYFTDCARNETSHTFNITIEDNEAPTIDCPTPLSQVVGVDPGSCVAELAIPLFTNVHDNCAVTTPFVQTQPTGNDQLLTFDFQPNLDDFLANDKEFVFTGVTDFVAPGFINLTVEILGDVDDTYEYFNIYDQDGNWLGDTEFSSFNVTPGDSCSVATVAQFQVASSTFNNWVAASDTIRFWARVFNTIPVPPGGPDYGINPCDGSTVVADGQNDGVSRIWATLHYESIAPTLSGTGATDITPIVLQPPLQAPVYTLDRGVTTFTYEVDDLEGNHGECQFTIEVIDNEAPSAICKPSVFIEINPSGFVSDTIFPIDIDNGSFDNCEIASMEVFPNIIQCDMFGFFPVELTVYDSTGNTDVCQTFISVETTKPAPTIQHDCGNDTLFLFSNPPASPGGSNAFQYVWRDPNGVVVGVTKNLTILGANEDNVGFYTIEIEGVTGCTATGVVQVTCDDLPLRRPQVTLSKNNPCEEEDITFMTSAVCGTSVVYKWYQGTAPGGTLIATTTDPELDFTNTLATGSYKFYVIVERNGCPSVPSLEKTVTVKQKPVALPMVSFDSDPPCEGGTIILTAPVTVGTTCQWTGPAGFSSSSCDPAPITNITTANGGNTPYTLITTLNGCASDPATIQVTINERPDKPTITSNSSPTGNPECVGGTVVLEATAITGAVSYRWEGPNGMVFTTATNVLTLNDVNLGMQGGWTVTAVGNPCESEASTAVEVSIAMAPQGVSATVSPNPVCEGDELNLSAMSGSSNVSYLWTYPDGTQTAQQNPTIDEVEMPQDAGTYTLEVTNLFECKTTVTVDVDVLQNVDIAGVSAQVPNCVNGPVDIKLFAFPVTPINDGTYTWHWSGPDGFTYISSDSSAVILDANNLDNSGQYEVFVTNGDGCVSGTRTVDVNIPSVIATPSKPIADSPNPHCAGDVVVLETSDYDEAVEYVWDTPLGIFTTNTNTFEIDPLTVANTGEYTVSVMLDGCESNESGFLTLTVNPIPVVNPVSNSPVCEGEVLELNMSCNGDEYRWEGPGGFGISNLCSPIVANADPDAHEGVYKARKRVGGCWSEEVSIVVEIKDKPVSGTATNFGPYCSDTEDVVVSVTPATAPANATFTWYEASTNTPLGSTNSLSFTIPGANLYGNNCVEFYVVAEVDGCVSEFSNRTEVCMNTLPSNVAIAGDDQQICEDEILTLNATPPSVGEGRWEQISGPNVVTIANPDQPTTTVQNLQPGATYEFGWYLSNGACGDYSFDEVVVVVDIIETADAGDAIVVCNGNSTNLSAIMPASGNGMWTQSASQSIFVEITNPTNPNTSVTGLQLDNVYQFTWTIDGGCGTSSDVVSVTVVAESAFAGEDFEDCGDGCTQLSANPTAVGGGIWTSSDPKAEIISPTSPTTLVCNLAAGTTTFTWTINNGACGDDSVDEVVVTYYYAPEAVDDNLAVDFGGAGEVNILDNDQIPGDYFINILAEPVQGTYEISSFGMVSYQADINFVGQDVITYELCTVDCEDCSIANLTIDIGADAQCVAPTMITPNNDGMNDSFIVPCLSDKAAVPNNTISIFNQWGDEVHHASPYNNDWEGTFDGEDLPAGTFFYILDLHNGQEPMTGFFVIQR